MTQTVLLLGPSRAAISGVATHLNQIFASSLISEFRLLHFRIGSEGRNEGTVAKVVRFVGSPFALAGRIIADGSDVVHINTSINKKAFLRDLVYVIVAKLLARRIIYQIHGGALPHDFFGSHGPLASWARWVFRMPDAVLVLAEAERIAYEKFFTLKQLRVIPNAIDLRHYSGIAKRFDQKILKLVYIGRLAEGKGLFETLEALQLLHERGTGRFELSLAGGGAAEDSLRACVAKLGISAMVRFVGPVFDEDKHRFWTNAHLFVFPSWSEGLPYAVLESLASGTPLITTSVGGIPDAVTHGIHGIIVPPGDAVAIANALQALEMDRPRLHKMSAACIEKARQQYSIERLAKELAELYRG